MNNLVNFTTSETYTNSTTLSIGLNILEICIYSINFLFGLPANFYVIWLIVTGTRSGLSSEFFSLDLSISEIGNSVNSLFFILSTWVFQFFLIGVSATGRPLFQCLICVERYLAVVHPVIFLKFKPLRYRLICSSVVWIITLGSCLCCVFNLVSFKLYVHIWFLSVQFLLFLSIQLFCLVSVLRALKQSGPGDRKRRKENHKKRRAFYLILITTVNMVMIYIPITISALFTNLAELFIQEVWTLSLICFVLAGFVQPLLYLHRNGKLTCLCSS